jgi:hypothetical protein
MGGRALFPAPDVLGQARPALVNRITNYRCNEMLLYWRAKKYNKSYP